MGMNLENIGRLWRTIRYLRPEQIWARISYRACCIYYQSPLYPILEELEQASTKLVLTPPNLWQANPDAGKKMLTNTFTFINRSIHFGRKVNWHPQEASALWLYNLHYHSWLNDLRIQGEDGATHARTLLESWLESYGKKFHKQVWHPYPLSLRLVNWLTHAQWLTANGDKAFSDSFFQSLHLQVHHLERNLEWDVGGNHLIKNLKALIYAGLCLPGRQSIYLEAMQLTTQQLELQILPDGSHYERSPHYHVDVLTDLLDIHALILKAGHKAPHQLDEAIDRMADALACYQYPDGLLGLFNDGSLGNTEHLKAVIARVGLPDQPPSQLPDAGYIHLKHGDMFAFMDAGICCPDDLPAHAHADMLSFELMLGQQRIFTNVGTYAYQHPRRNKFRGTSAHNTLTFDHEDSAEVWSTFRLGRRPRNVTYTHSSEKGTGSGIQASHDGYRHLKAHHTRSLFMDESGSQLRGEDTLNVKDKKSHTATAHFHLHPTIKLAQPKENEAVLTLPDGQKLSFLIHGGTLQIKPSFYAPQFGELHESQQLTIHSRFEGALTLKWRLKKL